MTDAEIEAIRRDLKDSFPEANVVLGENRQEIIAELGDGTAVAVIQRSAPHFHTKTQELYRVLRGTLVLSRGARGLVLLQGQTLTIEPGQIHFARSEGAEPAWVEVKSIPPWSPSDHFVV